MFHKEFEEQYQHFYYEHYQQIKLDLNIQYIYQPMFLLNNYYSKKFSKKKVPLLNKVIPIVLD